MWGYPSHIILVFAFCCTLSDVVIFLELLHPISYLFLPERYVSDQRCRNPPIFNSLRGARSCLSFPFRCFRADCLFYFSHPFLPSGRHISIHCLSPPYCIDYTNAIIISPDSSCATFTTRTASRSAQKYQWICAPGKKSPNNNLEFTCSARLSPPSSTIDRPILGGVQAPLLSSLQTKCLFFLWSFVHQVLAPSDFYSKTLCWARCSTQARPNAETPASFGATRILLRRIVGNHACNNEGT